MAIKDMTISGKVRTGDGTRVSGAIVSLLEHDADLGGSAHGTTVSTSSSGGTWSFTVEGSTYALTNNWDVKISSSGGDSIRYLPWSDEIALKGVDTSYLKVRGADTVAAPIYLLADRADDAGDAWRMQATTSDTFTIGSDKAVAGAIIDYVTITNGASAAASVVALGGDLTVGDDLSLTSDSAVFNMGAGNDFTITHDGTTGATIAGNPLTLDSGADIVLDAEGADVILKDGGTQYGSLTNSSSNLLIKSGSTTALTFSGANVTSAGTYTGAGLMTTGGNIVIPDAGNIGSASDTDAIAISSGGVVTMNQIPVFSAGINVSGGTIAGTLATAAQTAITSVGTLTALTVDDVAVNGKVITMTGSASDTAVFTAGTNGTLSIVTTDDAAAAANIQITADGTAELAGTTVTLDSAADIELEAANDINIPANIGLTFGDDGEKIEGDGTDLTIASSAKLNLSATSDVHVPKNVGIVFDDNASEKIESNNTDLTINSGADINLTATGDVNMPANVGITFGDDAEKIEGDGTDLTISGNNINLTATADVVIPANVGITFGSGEKIEGDSTDLTVTSGADINLTATSDINVPANVGITFGDDAEKIEGDGTDLTIAGNIINLTPADNVKLNGNTGIGVGANTVGTDFAVTGGGGDYNGTNIVSLQVGTTAGTATTRGFILVQGTSDCGLVLGGSSGGTDDKKMMVRYFQDSNLSSGSAGTLDLGRVDDSAKGMNADDLGLQIFKSDLSVNVPNGNLFIGDTANANMTQGLTINQGAADNEIITFKSSDVAHGITAQTETDTFAKFRKIGGTTGGLSIDGFGEAEYAVRLRGMGVTDNTDKTINGIGYVELLAYKKSGSDVGDPGSDANLAVIRKGGDTRFIFDAEGSAHADVEWTTYDTYDDIALINDLEDELRAREDEAQTTRRKMLEDTGIIGEGSWHVEDGKPRAMVDMTKLSMLHHGALMQAGERIKELETRLLSLEGGR